MKFTALGLPDAYLVEAERHEDARGYFLRTWCRKEFSQQIGEVDFVQSSLSFNRVAGTLRGLHFQAEPFAEAKLVRCVRGAIYDVIVDIRPHSSTFRRWVGMELSAENGRALFVPSGFAHGFQCLRDDTEVAYQISQYHSPEAARGIRWNDPAFGVQWPGPITVMSERDRNWPDYIVQQAA
jgi:dTDP-4-dehydrorhamnose 3,5-epimerase